MKESLSALYKAIGISKQALHQRLDRMKKTHDLNHQLLHLIHEIRKDHPTMNSRDMYFKLQPQHIGRDKFEAFCKLHGFLCVRPVNYARTTDSSGVVRFPDLTVGLELTRIDQV